MELVNTACLTCCGQLRRTAHSPGVPLARGAGLRCSAAASFGSTHLVNDHGDGVFEEDSSLETKIQRGVEGCGRRGLEACEGKATHFAVGNDKKRALDRKRD